MERLLQRAYERLGPRYMTIGIWGALPFNVFATAVGVISLLLYFHGTFRQWLELMAGAVPLSAACIAVTYLSLPDILAPMRRWMRAERTSDSAVDLWNALNEGLIRIIRRGLVVFIPPFALYPLYAMWRLDLPIYAYPGIYGGVLIIIAWSAVMILFWAEAAMRPPLVDAAKLLPPDFTPTAPPLTARQKIIISSTVFATANIVTVGALFASIDLDPAIGLALFVPIALAASISVAMVGNAFVARSVFGPVTDLGRAARLVGDGDLSARIAIMSGDEFGMLSDSFNRMVRGLAERQALHSALGSYVDPHIAERLLAEGELLDGTYVDVTVLFLDLRGFTTRSETQDAADTVSYLNDLFERVVPLVAAHGGHVNKFTGDGLLAVFGTPEHHEDHADRALAAAREISQTLSAHAVGGFGVGINSGKVVAGTIGGGGHLEFAVIGDAVNVASRVEGLTKDTGDTVLVTGETKARLNGSGHQLVDRGRHQLRGRAEPIDVYALTDLSRARE